MNNQEISIWEKINLAVEKVAECFGIGQGKIRELSDDSGCSYVLWVGNKHLIKRQVLENYLDVQYSI